MAYLNEQEEPQLQPIDLLVHEATGTSVSDAHELKQEELQSESQVASKMYQRGHSTSFMAGQFAHRVRAKRLVLNHLGGKFPAPQACLCPSNAFPSSSSQPSTPQLPAIADQNGLKIIHAGLWKKFEETDAARQAKVHEELAWLQAVEKDALDGWRSASQDSHSLSQSKLVNQSPTPDQTDESECSSPVPRVSVAYDFLQIKVPRSDLTG
jgi:ribonuclease Z